MKIDALQQYAKLKQQLVEEKHQLEERLNDINQVLGAESAAAPAAPGRSTSRMQRRGSPRRARGGNTLTMREAVMRALAEKPLARQELVQAVENLGYVFTTSNPLNSLGSVLYAKGTPIRNKAGKFYLPGRAVPETIETDSGAASGARKYTRSAESRARMSEAQKARWAKARA